MRQSSARRRLLSNRTAFAIVFLVVNLHILRNVALVPYLASYAMTCAWVATRLVGKPPIVRLGMPALWVGLALCGFITTTAISGYSASTFGLVRFLFAFPVFLALLAFTDHPDDIRDHMRTMVVVFALGSLTVPLQFVTGPIGFFAADAERAGVDRFASIFGSLTSLGVAAGSYLALSYGLSSLLRLFTALAISVGGIASLSKAAIANIGIGLASGPVAQRTGKGRAAVGLAVAIAAIATSVLQSEDLSRGIRATAVSFGFDSGVVTNDQSVTQSAADRVTRLPMENRAALRNLESPLVYAVGGGFGMASTALVPAEASLAPMAHNQFAEFVSVFGYVGGGAFLAITAAIGVRLMRRWRGGSDNISGPTFFAFSIWAVNSIFANGTAYQPAMASILYFSMFVALMRVAPEGVASDASVNEAVRG